MKLVMANWELRFSQKRERKEEKGINKKVEELDKMDGP